MPLVDGKASPLSTIEEAMSISDETTEVMTSEEEELLKTLEQASTHREFIANISFNVINLNQIPIPRNKPTQREVNTNTLGTCLF